MMNINLDVINMPNAAETRIITEICKQQIAYEQREKEVNMENRATEDLPRFIRYINSRIEKARTHGWSSVHFSYNSEQWEIKDSRCDFTFKGTPNEKHAEFVSNLYKELGFYGYVHSICCTNCYAYRDGEVYLSW